MATLTGLGLGVDGLERQVHTGLQVVISDPWIDFDDLELEVPAVLTLTLMPSRIAGIADLGDQLADLCERDGHGVSSLSLVVSGNPQGFWLGKDWVSAATVLRHISAFDRVARCLSGDRAQAAVHCHEDGLSAPLRHAIGDLLGIPVSDTIELRIPQGPVGAKGRLPGGYRFITSTVQFNPDPQ